MEPQEVREVTWVVVVVVGVGVAAQPPVRQIHFALYVTVGGVGRGVWVGRGARRWRER